MELVKVRSVKHPNITKTITLENWKTWVKGGYGKAFRIVERISSDKDLNQSSEKKSNKKTKVIQTPLEALEAIERLEEEGSENE